MVHKIQTLDSKLQEELMRCINEVSATLPDNESTGKLGEGLSGRVQGRGSKRASPEKRAVAQTESATPPISYGTSSELMF